MKPSRTHRTQQEVLDAHVLQHSLNSMEVFLTPISIHRVSEMVGIHQIFQVVLPSPRIPCSWGRPPGLPGPVDSEQRLCASLPDRGS